MSAVIKAARTTGQGHMNTTDGGLLSFLGGAVKTLATGAAGFLAGGPAGAAATLVPGLVAGRPGGGSGLPSNLPALPTPGVGGAIQRFLPGGKSGYVSQVPTKGYHLNKTSYFLKDGTFVPEGSRLVKNRRRNPLNPRALRRAIARIDAGKVWQAKLHEISTAKYTAAGTRKC